jgi:preprotein translocase subunit SecA
VRLWNAIFGEGPKNRGVRHRRRVDAIGALEPALAALSDAELARRSEELRARARAGTPLDALLEPAYALVREAAKRTLGMRPFDVQLMGGIALHEGLVAELKTGEGKTLVATAPVYLNALAGQGVHVVTVNDYLAERDAAWMGPLYRFLGLSVGVIVEDIEPEGEGLRQRREAYACDVTYGTNHEIAFDYLRDNLAREPGELVHRGFHFAIVDEVDFLLVDEARTPLIISGPSDEDLGELRRVERAVRKLREDEHYVKEHRTRTVALRDSGVEALSRDLRVENLFAQEHVDLYHAVHQALQARAIFRRDVDYIVERGSVYLIDEFTGRVSEDKRFADGLHSALEAKENLRVQPEDRTLAKITYQTFFGRYAKLAGMTGTAWSERQEFERTYRMQVQVIPTHRPMLRVDLPELVFDTRADKLAAVVREIAERRGRGQPVLVGTVSVQESEQLARDLKRARIPHALLNAKNHRAEAEIIAQAGRLGAVTISTNMAGRGTDILLGGNPELLAKGRPRELEALRESCAREREQVIAAGGLHVIGTAFHESVRIDDQLRGRSARQGDPGSSQFMICLDDDIWKQFGQTDIERLRAELESTGHKSGEPIALPTVLPVLRKLQHKTDVENQGLRQRILSFDLVEHTQREAIYAWRRELMAGSGPGADLGELVRSVARAEVAHSPDVEALREALAARFHAPFELTDAPRERLERAAQERALALLAEREQRFGKDALHELGRQLLLDAIDELWTDHLSNLERTIQSIELESYAELDPLVQWRVEALRMWEATLERIRARAATLWFRVSETTVHPSAR